MLLAQYYLRLTALRSNASIAKTSATPRRGRIFTTVAIDLVLLA